MGEGDGGRNAPLPEGMPRLSLPLVGEGGRAKRERMGVQPCDGRHRRFALRPPQRGRGNGKSGLPGMHGPAASGSSRAFGAREGPGPSRETRLTAMKGRGDNLCTDILRSRGAERPGADGSVAPLREAGTCASHGPAKRYESRPAILSGLSCQASPAPRMQLRPCVLVATSVQVPRFET